MAQLDRENGQNYADNVIDAYLYFGTSQTWTASSGTGTGTLDTTLPFVGDSSLKIENTAPTTDLVVTNSTQSTVIDFNGDYELSWFLRKDDALQAYSGEIEIFKNAVSYYTQAFTLGGDDSNEFTNKDYDQEWVRFVTDGTLEFLKSDVVTMTIKLDGISGYLGASTTLWIDGLMLNQKERVNMMPPNYIRPSALFENTDTGWAQYGDSQYTSGSPLSITAGSTEIIDIDGLGSTIKTQLPLGVADLYDVPTSKITPVMSGDGIGVTISFKAESNNTNGYCVLGVDIGGSFGEIFRRTVTFPRGSGVEHDFTISTIGYTLGTFLANGGIIKATSGIGTTSIYDVTLQVHRFHKGR